MEVIKWGRERVLVWGCCYFQQDGCKGPMDKVASELRSEGEEEVSNAES